VNTFAADLHIHTCLSPCGELTMSPRAIAQAALDHGLDLIAVADHNTAGMVDVVAQAAADAGLAFLYGMELQTREEVHLLAYFDEPAACHGFAAEIYRLLPDHPNEPAFFGDQVVVDLDETILRTEPKLLLNSLDLGFDEAVRSIRDHGGLAIPAHVDRETFGLIAQLGFPPAELSFEFVEAISGHLPDGFGAAQVICSSDAHTPGQIGRRRTLFGVKEVSIEEMIKAARQIDGRSVRCESIERRET